jgi:polyhydroxybutyrate depolymerase
MKSSVWVFVLFVTGATGCARSNAPTPNKNTNWLQECTSDRACGAGLSCLCGICTRSCATMQDCAISGDQAT